MRILFDFTVFYNGTTKTASRSGIYLSAYNILSYLLKDKRFTLSLYCRTDKNLYKKIFSEVYPQYSIDVLDDSDDLTSFDIFVSPAFATPKKILHKKHITKFFILYDIIPLLMPEYFSLNASWLFEMMRDINSNDHYFTISDYTKEDFIKYFPTIDPHHITTIPLAASEIFYPCHDKNTINKVKKKYNIPYNKKYILSLCTLEPRKNLMLAIKAFIAFVKNSNINDTVYILGGGHWPGFDEEIKKQISGYQNFSDHIFQIGYVDDEDMAALYSGAEFFIYTSLYEGFGLPPLEAMQCGTAVITSNTTSLPEVVDDAAIKINPYSLDEHINAISNFYYNGQLRQSYREAGLNRAKNFSWDKCAKIIGNTIEETTTKNYPLVSIITPLDLYENSKQDSFIRCINSIQKQIYPGKIEHIIVNCSSTDNILQIIKKVQNFQPIHIFSAKSESKYDAYNIGIQNAKGQYICFLNSEDFYHRNDGLLLTVRAIQNTNAQYCLTDTYFVAENEYSLWPGTFSELPFGNYPCIEGIIFSRKIFSNYIFDTTVKEKALWKFLLQIALEKYIYNDCPFVTYGNPKKLSLESAKTNSEHAFLFYQYLGKKLFLTLEDCLLLMNQELLKDTSYEHILELASRLQNPEWIKLILEKSGHSISDKLSPITTKDIRRYIRYKIYSHIFIGKKRKYYKAKYHNLKIHLKKDSSF